MGIGTPPLAGSSKKWYDHAGRDSRSQDLVLVQVIIYHWVVMLSLLILSSSSFLINIILEL